MTPNILTCETLNAAKVEAAKAAKVAADKKAKDDADADKAAKADGGRLLSSKPSPAVVKVVKKENWVFGTGEMMSVDYLFDRLGVNAQGA
jgi:hypothetical protein